MKLTPIVESWATNIGNVTAIIFFISVYVLIFSNPSQVTIKKDALQRPFQVPKYFHIDLPVIKQASCL